VRGKGRSTETKLPETVDAGAPGSGFKATSDRYLPVERLALKIPEIAATAAISFAS
jgi:hypothetical protein